MRAGRLRGINFGGATPIPAAELDRVCGADE